MSCVDFSPHLSIICVASHQQRKKKGVMKEEYAVVAVNMGQMRFSCRILSRAGFPECVAFVARKKKDKFFLQPGTIITIDATDLDKNGGDADVMEVVSDSKELRKLRHAGIIPAEDDMPLIASTGATKHLSSGGYGSGKQKRGGASGANHHEQSYTSVDDLAAQAEQIQKAKLGASDGVDDCGAPTTISDPDVLPLEGVGEDPSKTGKKTVKLTKTQKHQLKRENEELLRVEQQSVQQAKVQQVILGHEQEEVDADLDDL